MIKKYKTGDIRNGLPVLDSKDRKTILVISDDLRMSSGVAVMTKEFIFGLIHRYNFVQLGAAINHPDKGKELDLNEDTTAQSGVDNAFIRLVPWTGYGDANIIRQLMMKFKPDAIMIFTDPRYFRYLFDIEAEIRENIPILYYNIWDCGGAEEDNYATDPQYNESYYASCDGLFGISKQTYGITTRVLKNKYDDEINILTV